MAWLVISRNQIYRRVALILRSGNRTREQQNSTGKGRAADKSRHDAPPNSKRTRSRSASFLAYGCEHYKNKKEIKSVHR